jgi:hypothetical protein
VPEQAVARTAGETAVSGAACITRSAPDSASATWRSATWLGLPMRSAARVRNPTPDLKALLDDILPQDELCDVDSVGGTVIVKGDKKVRNPWHAFRPKRAKKSFQWRLRSKKTWPRLTVARGGARPP